MKKFLVIPFLALVFLLAGCGDKAVSNLIDEVDTDAIDTDAVVDTDSTNQSDTTDSTDTNAENPADTNTPEPTDTDSADTNTPEPVDTDSADTNTVDPVDTDSADTNTPDPADTDSADTNTVDPVDTDSADTNTPDPADTEVPDTETPDEDIPDVEIEFERITVDDNPNKPAFVTVEDLDNDGHLDMIVAQYGPALSGNYDIYWGTGDLNQWTKETLNIGGNNGISFPHPVKVADVNGDGIKDIVSPSGFLACLVNCGNIFWLEGTGERNQWIKHEIVTNNDHFFFDVSLVDIDGDGKLDILTNSSQKKAVNLFGPSQDEQLMWFKGTDTDDRFEKTATVISEGNGGPFPRFVDINGDGKKDIALAQFFNDDIEENGSFIWFEQVDLKNNKWNKHIIDSESGPSFMLEIIDNLYGDGVRRAVGVNHVNSADKPNGPKEGVFIFDIPSNPAKPWSKTNIATDIQSRNPLIGGSNQAAPGLFGYGDITGNGLIDLVVSGDGDSRVFWFEQKPAGTFTQHTLDGEKGASTSSSSSFGQAGGMKIVDLDGDGANEIIVTTYESNKLYIYKVKK